MKKVFLLFAFGIVTTLFFSCTYMPLKDLEPDEPEEVSFKADLLPIFSRCAGCHPPSGGLDLSSANAYASINDGRVDIENPTSSLIYTVPLSDHKGKEYSDFEAKLVLKWIEAGALDN